MRITSAALLSNCIRENRKKNKITQTTLAHSIGLKQATVSAFEHRAENAQLQTLFKILAGLNLELHIQPRHAIEKGHDSGWDQEW